MFKALREKLSGWFGKKEKVVEDKPKKAKKEKKEIKKVEKKVGVGEKEVKKKKEATKKVEKKADVGEKKGKAEEKVEAKEILEEVVKEVKEKEDVKERVEDTPEEQDVELIEEEIDSVKEEDLGEIGEIEQEEEIAEPEASHPPTHMVVDAEEEKEKKVVKESDEGKGFFFNLKKKLLTSVLKQEEFDEIFEDFEMTLLENNVALEVVDKIREELGKDLVGVSLKKREVEKTIVESLKKAILSVLVEGDDLMKKIEESLEMPYVILFFGINGSGKTTSVAKLAYKLKKKGIGCVLAAADTFRAASIEQLETHGKDIGVDVVKSQYGADPASVAFDAIQYAKKHKKKVVLIDTAGRMYTKANLMKEMEKIVKVSKPHLKIFVGESITGNDATEQAKMFNETAGIDGIILSKADVDEKAGAILSVSYVTGKPILFLGTGQEMDDLKEFHKEDVLKNLGLD